MKSLIARHNLFGSRFIELVYFEDRNDKQFIGTMTIKEFPEGEYISDPTMRLEREEAQALMDSLWQCGLRPSEGSGSAGSLAATQRHLSDMQEIAKGLLRKSGVNL